MGNTARLGGYTAQPAQGPVGLATSVVYIGTFVPTSRTYNASPVLACRVHHRLIHSFSPLPAVSATRSNRSKIWPLLMLFPNRLRSNIFEKNCLRNNTF